MEDMTKSIDKQYVVGIDVGGQTTKIGVVDARGQVLAQTVIRSDNYEDANPYLDEVAAAIRKVVSDADVEGQIRGIGIGAPNGNYYTGMVEMAPNVIWAKSKAVPVAEMLSERLDGIPVALTNDANAAALGEFAAGAGRGVCSYIVINGEVVYGHDGFAGELGHVRIVRNNGRLCGCGRTGCLEAYCSAIGVARTAREWLEMTDEPSLLRGTDNIS